MSLFTELKRRNVFRVGIAYGVVAWFIIQAADIMLANFGAPGWVFRSVAGLLALGFPLALFLSWAYELTPEGVKKSADVTSAESATPRTGRRIDRVILVGALAVIAVMGVERVWFAGGRGELPAASADSARVESIFRKRRTSGPRSRRSFIAGTRRDAPGPCSPRARAVLDRRHRAAARRSAIHPVHGANGGLPAMARARPACRLRGRGR